MFTWLWTTEAIYYQYIFEEGKEKLSSPLNTFSQGRAEVICPAAVTLHSTSSPEAAASQFKWATKSSGVNCARRFHSFADERGQFFKWVGTLHEDGIFRRMLIACRGNIYWQENVFDGVNNTK